MQLWRFIKFMFGLTILALIYIHMQMNIFSLAYDGKQKEQNIVRLKEQNGRGRFVYRVEPGPHDHVAFDRDQQVLCSSRGTGFPPFRPGMKQEH